MSGNDKPVALFKCENCDCILDPNEECPKCRATSPRSAYDAPYMNMCPLCGGPVLATLVVRVLAEGTWTIPKPGFDITKERDFWCGSGCDDVPAAWVRREMSRAEASAAMKLDAIRELEARQDGTRLTITCCFCGAEVPAETAHLHRGLWIGECCWDESIRAGT